MFDRIGQYEIIEELGRGAMGEVYRARDTKLFDRPVAVKILAAHLSEREIALQRFRLEVEVAAKLAHPNIVTIFDMGQFEGRDYFVMEYIDGFDFGQLIAGIEKRGLVEKLRLAVQVCRGLAHAHEAKVVHRDLKPANIMVGTQGGQDQAKIVDFGIVHVDRSSLTQDSMQPGTFSYMAPEQIRSESGGSVDPRSDLFSLGVVFYEVFTGAHPFAAQSELLIANEILNAAPKPLREADRSLPAELEACVMEMLDKDPGRRPAGAGAIADRLEELLAILHPSSERRAAAGAVPPPRTDSVPADTVPADDVARALDEARGALEQGRLDSARVTLVEVLRHHTEEPRARALLDRIMHLTASAADAKAYFAELRLARTALDRGDAAQAVRRAARAGELCPDDVEWRQLHIESQSLAERELSARLHDAALELQEVRAANLPPDESRRRLETAREQLDRALETSPDNAEARLLRDEITAALASVATTRAPAAETELERLMREARQLLDEGMELLRDDRLPGAEARPTLQRAADCFERVLDVQPERPTALDGLDRTRRALRRAGRKDRAAPPPSRVGARPRARSGLLFGAGIAAAVVVVGGALFLWLSMRDGSGPPDAPGTTARVPSAADRRGPSTAEPAGPIAPAETGDPFAEPPPVDPATETQASEPPVAAEARAVPESRAEPDRMNVTADPPSEANPAAAPQSAPAAVRSGSLSLRSSPSGATLFVDGRSSGRTPVTGLQLEEGTHRLRLEHAGYADWTGEAMVRAGRSATETITLQPLPARLRVSTRPAGAEVFVDGSKVGVSEWVANYAAGSHVVELRKPGYLTAKLPVDLEPGEQKNVDVVLKAAPTAAAPAPPVPAPEDLDSLWARAEGLHEEEMVHSLCDLLEQERARLSVRDRAVKWLSRCDDWKQDRAKQMANVVHDRVETLMDHMEDRELEDMLELWGASPNPEAAAWFRRFFDRFEGPMRLEYELISLQARDWRAVFQAKVTISAKERRGRSEPWIEVVNQVWKAGIERRDGEFVFAGPFP